MPTQRGVMAWVLWPLHRAERDLWWVCHVLSCVASRTAGGGIPALRHPTAGDCYGYSTLLAVSSHSCLKVAWLPGPVDMLAIISHSTFPVS